VVARGGLRGMGGEQPQPRVGVVFLKLTQVPVARIPGAVLQVTPHDIHHTILHLRGDTGGARGRAAGLSVEHTLGVAPEGAERPVGRVARDRRLLARGFGAQSFREQLGRGEDAPVELGDLGKVVGHMRALT
jgi:hypothetical protein